MPAAPRLASYATHALPIPIAPPVTMAVRPWNSMFYLILIPTTVMSECLPGIARVSRSSDMLHWRGMERGSQA